VHAPGGIGTHAARIAGWVAQYPRLRVFIPHLGWPCTAQGVPTPGWAAGMRALAACDRVFCGLSALYFFSHHGLPFEDSFEFVQAALQAFGPMHCVLAGDYPMTLERCTYTQVWEALAQAVADPAALEQAWAKTPAQLWGEGCRAEP
jgi:predicted TIM-barrel fold metal-dependent hydrolase